MDTKPKMALVGRPSGAVIVGGMAWKARCMSELPSTTAITRRGSLWAPSAGAGLSEAGAAGAVSACAGLAGLGATDASPADTVFTLPFVSISAIKAPFVSVARTIVDGIADMRENGAGGGHAGRKERKRGQRGAGDCTARREREREPHRARTGQDIGSASAKTPHTEESARATPPGSSGRCLPTGTRRTWVPWRCISLGRT